MVVASLTRQFDKARHMADPDTLTSLGLRIPDLVAGLAGGVVNAIVFKRSTPIAVVGSMLVGALTANYLAETAVKYTGTSQGSAAFLVGLCGMILCQVLVSAAAKYIPPILKNGRDA